MEASEKEGCLMVLLGHQTSEPLVGVLVSEHYGGFHSL